MAPLGRPVPSRSMKMPRLFGRTGTREGRGLASWSMTPSWPSSPPKALSGRISSLAVSVDSNSEVQG
eukprot:12120170-Heterocapsa_arctica.AAC.1